MKTNEVKKAPIEIVDRSTILGGSDANRIMRGDWHTLWLEKTKREEPEDLSWNLPVQIGLHTETVNKMFFEKETGIETLDPIYTESRVQNMKEFMYASYDLVGREEDTIVELKHTNSNNTLDNCISTYMPQVQHYLMVSEYKYAYLSVIFGNQRHEVCKIDADKDYQKKLYDIEKSFWSYVTKDKEPEKLDTSELPKLAGKIKINDMTTIDFNETGNNEFLSHASRWEDTKSVADEHKALGSILKGFVPDDCRRATGGNVLISRTKAGYLTIKQNQRR
tara:strand:+ start:271 stop:1104 length:834 start_codon:yes stop_codon:yes gene_type:complete